MRETDDFEKGVLPQASWKKRRDIDLVGADAPTDILDNAPCKTKAVGFCSSCGGEVPDHILALFGGLCPACRGVEEPE